MWLLVSSIWLTKHWCAEPTPSAKANTVGPGRQHQTPQPTQTSPHHQPRAWWDEDGEGGSRLPSGNSGHRALLITMLFGRVLFVWVGLLSNPALEEPLGPCTQLGGQSRAAEQSSSNLARYVKPAHCRTSNHLFHGSSQPRHGSCARHSVANSTAITSHADSQLAHLLSAGGGCWENGEDESQTTGSHPAPMHLGQPGSSPRVDQVTTHFTGCLAERRWWAKNSSAQRQRKFRCVFP